MSTSRDQARCSCSRRRRGAGYRSSSRPCCPRFRLCLNHRCRIPLRRSFRRIHRLHPFRLIHRIRWCHLLHWCRRRPILPCHLCRRFHRCPPRRSCHRCPLRRRCPPFPCRDPHRLRRLRRRFQKIPRYLLRHPCPRFPPRRPCLRRSTRPFLSIHRFHRCRHRRRRTSVTTVASFRRRIWVRRHRRRLGLRLAHLPWRLAM